MSKLPARKASRQYSVDGFRNLPDKRFVSEKGADKYRAEVEAARVKYYAKHPDEREAVMGIRAALLAAYMARDSNV